MSGLKKGFYERQTNVFVAFIKQKWHNKLYALQAKLKNNRRSKMNGKHMKFENPIRLKELDPERTLKKIGLQENSVFCDIGAGSGIFTLPAAVLTRNRVYALEISDEMIAIIKERASAMGLNNIETVQVNPDNFNVEDQCADIALMVTVLHEIDNKSVFLNNVKKLLKNDGKAVVIEFHKKATSLGPPEEHRIGRDDVLAEMNEAGFEVLEDFDLGENFYCMIFKC